MTALSVESQFLKACMINDCQAIRDLISKRCNLLVRNEHGQNGLHVASFCGHDDVVSLLIELYGFNPVVSDSNGRTALHLACQKGFLSISAYLVDQPGVNLIHQCSLGNTPLHYACISGDVPTVRFVMSKMSKVLHMKENLYKDEIRVYTCSSKFFENAAIAAIIKLMINNDGDTALHSACRGGHLRVIKFFVEELQVNQLLCEIFWSVSDLACNIGQYEICTYLVDNICNPPNIFLEDSDTPISRESSSNRWKSLVASGGQLPQYQMVSFRSKALASSFSIACKNGDKEMVSLLIEKYKFDPLELNKETGYSALHFACSSTNPSLVSYLIQQGCNPRMCNNEGDTPLHVACKWGHLGIVKLLITADMSINSVNKEMRTPLDVACVYNRTQIVKQLMHIESCSLTTTNISNESPLHIATCLCNYELIDCLLERSRENVDLPDCYGDTPFFNACRTGNMDIVKLLVDKGCNPVYVNKMTNEMPIHIACRMENRELFLFLKEYMLKELWHHMNILEQSPLHVACEKGNTYIVSKILEHDSANNEHFEGKTPMHIACQRNNLQIAKIIIAQQEVSHDINARDQDRNSPLHIACANNNIEMVKLLMQHNAGVTSPNSNGDTPVHIASCHKNVFLLCTMLPTEKLGITFGVNNFGVTPLHIASSNGSVDIVKYLITKKFCDPIESTERMKYTPLHFACSLNHTKIAVYLAECAPQTLHALDINGRHPLYLALQQRNYDLIKVLVPHFCDPNTVKCKEGIPLFIHCCELGDTDLLKYLVSVGKCQPTVTLPDGYTTAHAICNFYSRSSQKKIDSKFLYILEISSSQINCKNNKGDTPLIIACTYRMTEIIPKLLQHNADPNCRNLRGESALHITCRQKLFTSTKELIKYNADVSCKDSSGSTLLHVFADCCNDDDKESTDLLLLILEKDKEVNACRNLDGKTPLHILCQRGLHCYVKLLLQHNADSLCKDQSENTPLHIACMRNSMDLVTILIENNAINSFRNVVGKTPIQVTNSDEIITFLIDHGANAQDVFVHYAKVLELCKQKVPLHELVKVFVVGNTLAGKTTLVETLKSEGVIAKNLTGFKPKRTAGIESSEFKSNEFGRVVFHDFAGHLEFYSSSHSQFLESNFSSDTTIVLLLVDIRESELARNIQYWIDFIKLHCSRGNPSRQIIIIGSHWDQIELTNCRKEEVMNQTIQCLGPIFLDCRDPSSDGLCLLKTLLHKECNEIRKNIEIESQCHILCAFVHSEFTNFVQLSELQRRIRKSRKIVPSDDLCRLLPATLNALLYLLGKLEKIGNILMLKSEGSNDNYWIVLKQNFVYQVINGSLFSPNVNEKVSLISNIGVLPLSFVKNVLSTDVDLDLAILYLVHKEFCHPVEDPDTLKLISNEVSQPTEMEVKFYFFPHFVNIEKPQRAWKQNDDMFYCSGWCLQLCKMFFTTRFLHILLLRLTFKYAVAQGGTSSKFRRRCNIWKNGIQWQTTQGVEVLVELTHNLTFLLVLVRSLTDTKDQKEKEMMECVKLRASVIRTVLDAVQQTSPGLKTTEYLIDRGSLSEYPQRDLTASPKIEMHEVVETIRKGHPRVYDTNGEAITLERLLYFEPFAGIGENLLSLICVDHEESNKEIPSDKVLSISEHFHDRVDKLQYMLNVSKVQMGDLEAKDSVQDNSKLLVFHIFDRWKVSTQNGSYSELRKAFDQYSIFNGRNPLSLSTAREEPMTM